MKIRAITAFSEIHENDTETPLARAATFLHAATYHFQHSGVKVQSRRIATQPFPQMSLSRGPVGVPALAARLREQCTAYGIDYLGLGPVGAADDPDYVDALPEIFGTAPGIFASIDIASPAQGIDLGLLRHSAEIIHAVSKITSDGLTNLYLAALANCRPGSPFFPAAYHSGGAPRFALAIEAADLVGQAFEDAPSPEEARQRLQALISHATGHLAQLAEELAREHNIGFGGLDFSLAPYPGEMTSLAGGMEQLGVSLGGAGMVAAAALVMNAVEAAQFPRCGFSGLMLPVLEDSILGQRVAEGNVQINDLLLYSAICGTGLDCIPLPGDVSAEVLASILLDVSALALRLNKPLTARLMPLPGKVAGDATAFPGFEYFAPSRVMVPPSSINGAAFGSSSTFNVLPRS